jgi:hypothetical protein
MQDITGKWCKVLVLKIHQTGNLDKIIVVVDKK